MKYSPSNYRQLQPHHIQNNTHQHQYNKLPWYQLAKCVDTESILEHSYWIYPTPELEGSQALP